MLAGRRAQTWPLTGEQLVWALVPVSYLDDPRTRVASPPSTVTRWLSSVNRHWRDVHATRLSHRDTITQSRSLYAEPTSRDPASTADVINGQTPVASPPAEDLINGFAPALEHVGWMFSGHPKPPGYRLSLPDGMKTPSSQSGMSLSSGHQHRSLSRGGSATPTVPGPSRPRTQLLTPMLELFAVIPSSPGTTTIGAISNGHSEQHPSNYESRSIAVQTGESLDGTVKGSLPVDSDADEAAPSTKRKRSESPSSDTDATTDDQDIRHPPHKRHKMEPSGGSLDA